MNMHVKSNLQTGRMKDVKYLLRCGIICVIIFFILFFMYSLGYKDAKRSHYTVKWLTESAILNKTNVRGMVCTLLKDEASYIQEWISFHLLIGVDLFIIYDDNSTDNLTQKLHFFRNNLIVIPWGSIDKGRANGEHIQSTRQVSAARHCVSQFGLIAEWLIFLDVDEFMFPCVANFTDIRLFIQDPSVKLECLKFGTGFEDRTALADELTIEKHTLRAPYDRIDRHASDIKGNFSSCKKNAKLCETEGSWKYVYNTRKYPQNHKLLAQTLTMHGSPAISAPSRQLTRDQGICCNHYGFRSTALAMHKAKKNRNSVLAMTVMNNESMALFNSVLDTTVLRYVKPVKNLLAESKNAFHKSYASG